MTGFDNKHVFLRAVSLILVLLLCSALFSACGQREETEPVPETDSIVTEAETASSVEDAEETVSEEAAETTTETTTETEAESTTQEVFEDKITFLLFGVDTVGYTEVDKGRSDMIKVVQIDPVARTIDFIGILRDSKVEIEGHDPQKINAAYMYGGPDLAIRTVNENFDLNIGNYVMINFSGLVILVDKIGGIDLEITQEEADAVNALSDGDYVGDGRQHYCIPLTGGKVHMDGSQALAFSRTRKIDNDFYRSDRQHKVLKAIIEKLKATPVTEYEDIVIAFFQAVKTNFPTHSILNFTRMGLGDYEVSTYRVPDEIYEADVQGGQDETQSWVWTYDTHKAGERINSILEGTFVPEDVTDDSYMKKY